MTNREIRDVLSRYVRATDVRDGAAQAKLFVDNGVIRVFSRSGTGPYTLAQEPTVGREAIAAALGAVPPLPATMFWHHLTTDHLIEVHGDEATVSAQFLVVNAIADPEPADGWPASPNPVRGAISALLAGYYEGRLIKTTDGWAFVALDIKHSLPIAAS